MEADITNLDVLIAAEIRISLIEIAIYDAESAIDHLPAATDIVLANKAAVENARSLVNDALDAGAELDEIDADLLQKLQDCEAKIAAIEAAVAAAEAAIAALPAEVGLADRSAVDAARDLVNAALAEGAVEADISNLNKLIAAENRIGNIFGAITIAENAIAALPDPADVTLDDLDAYLDAVDKVLAALDVGAVEADFDPLMGKLEAVGNTLDALWLAELIAGPTRPSPTRPIPGMLPTTKMLSKQPASCWKMPNLGATENDFPARQTGSG